MKPHKHAELIHAWADGATIEARCVVPNEIGEWKTFTNPNWDVPYAEYRIKPEPKSDVVKYAYVAMFGMDYLGLNNQISEYANLKLTFDTTGELKSAEVLK